MLGIMNSESFFKYTAGYVDGDGCFYVGITFQKPKMIKVYEASIQIVSVKKTILDKFQEFYGGYIQKKPFKSRHKDAYCWTIKGDAAHKTTLFIKDHLVDKQIQADLFIKYCENITSNNFRKVSSEFIDIREEMIKQIREDKHMNNFVTKEAIEKLNDLQFTVTPQELDYPYLAGLIDSEGCFRIKKWKPSNRPNEVYNINLEIGNTKLPILPWLVERFGGSVCFIPAKGVKKASATWTLSAAALFKILPKISPFLCGKKEVCDKLIEFQSTILPNGGDRHSELFHALFEKRRKIRERIIDEVHQLNKKGN